MRLIVNELTRTIKDKVWWVLAVVVMTSLMEVAGLSGPNVCMVQQKYNITKRIKYRAPMAVRSYVWCFNVPPRCSKWSTELRDLTRLEMIKAIDGYQTLSDGCRVSSVEHQTPSIECREFRASASEVEHRRRHQTRTIGRREYRPSAVRRVLNAKWRAPSTKTEERTAEMAVCCPGYKVKDISCVPVCPHGKTGHGCSEDCPPRKWGPNCVHDCKTCHHGSCSPINGECHCHPGWQGESCQTSLSTTPLPAVQLLTTPSASTKTTSVSPTGASSTNTIVTSTVTSLTITSTPVTTYTSTKNTTTTKSTTVSTESSSTKGIDVKTTAPSQHATHDVLTTNVPVMYRNKSMSIDLTTLRPKVEITQRNIPIYEIYNTTDSSLERTTATQTTVKSLISSPSEISIGRTRTTTGVVEKFASIKPEPETSTAVTVTTENASHKTRTEPSTKMMASKTTVKPTTVKFKPKEIWIRPAQKGESIMLETKLKSTHESSKHKVEAKKDLIMENTTPKTIIVSIIPTSVTYVTYKKLALTTSASQKDKITLKPHSKTVKELTKPITIQTSTFKPIATINILNDTARRANWSSAVTTILPNVTQHKSSTSSTAKQTFGSTVASKRMTNSMSSTLNINNRRLDASVSLTTPLPLPNRSTQRKTPLETSTHQSTTINVSLTKEHPTVDKKIVKDTQRNVTLKPATDVLEVPKTFTKEVDTNVSKTSITNDTKTEHVAEDPTKDEETFPILTEPEHITAVMGEKGNEKSSIDLISVISIAGGVMMAVITVAIVIVMLERCKKPTYEDVRKYNDISMQVMIENNDVPPPPYVRSIFHTPLPEPPSEKCHYQPISTLDRNLKQFMRPVVVQTISPLMLENFRGILECHYDHLPRRSHDFATMQSRCSLAPPSEERVKLLHPRAHSLTDSAIEAMKCEAKQDVLDTTTSEPLYAEIPCWRPPSEHAVEVVNTNGEAVTEL